MIRSGEKKTGKMENIAFVHRVPFNPLYHGKEKLSGDRAFEDGV